MPVSEINRSQGVAQELAVLVGVLLPGNEWNEEPLEELQGLVETAGAEVVGLMTQNRESPDKTTYLGKGKVEQLERLVHSTDADVVIFDNALSPAQIRNLEEKLEIKVLDRTEIILDIFANNAQTHEARLAVELAQLEYSLPRLKRMWTHLSRLKMGVGMRGPGEKQLETDRRLVEKRISDLKGELATVLRRKEQQVAARKERRTVSLVGYTNAGKSTLMNALTNAGVRAEDKLFATLDTRTRRWHLPGWGPVLLSDTVGFIRNLPHKLIASFKATLEEARQADLLLHVADASNPAVQDQISTVYKVLEEIGITEKNTVLILNKTDQLKDPHAIDTILRRYPNAVQISAATGDGIDRLSKAVSDALSVHFQNVDIETSVSNGRLLAYLADKGEILSRTFHENSVRIHCRIDKQYLGKIKDDEATIRQHSVNAPFEELESPGIDLETS